MILDAISFLHKAKDSCEGGNIRNIKDVIILWTTLVDFLLKESNNQCYLQNQP
jgi:hypothetical protein